MFLPNVNLSIPDGVSFSDLNLIKEAKGHFSLDHLVVGLVESHNNMRQGHIIANADSLLDVLLIEWYLAWTARGGQRHHDMDFLIRQLCVQQTRISENTWIQSNT